MIQRIQSLFLFLVFGLSIATYFFPIANYFSDYYSISLTVFGVEKFTEYSEDATVNTIPLIAILGLIALISFFTIFLFKKRPIQIKLIRFCLLIEVVYIALIFFYYSPYLEEVTGATASYLKSTGIYLPLVGLVLLAIANYFISKDEKLIRSADRLR